MKFVGTQQDRDGIGIYELVDTVSGVSYIGQTREAFIRRFWHHDCTLKNKTNSNAALQAAWERDGGDAFEFRVLHKLSVDDDFDRYERDAIAAARARGGAFNISDGGAGKSAPMSDHAKKIVGEKNRQHMTGRKHSEETKAKMRSSSRHQPLTEEHKERLREYMTNRVVSEETRRKVSLAYSGENSRTAKITNQQAADIRRMYMQGTTIAEIARSLAVAYGIVSNVVHNHTFTHVAVDGWKEFCEKTA